jgi:RNA polymerase sigma-70 factor (ECF subfamily)
MSQMGLLQLIIYIDKNNKGACKVIDPREKERLFEVTIAGNKHLLSVIARNNAPVNDWQDLKQEILMAFWKSLDSYDGESSGLGTWLFSVAIHTAKNFRVKNDKMKKCDEAVDSYSVFVEQGRAQPRIIEEFSGKMGELDRQVFSMYLENFSYADMSSALGVNEVNLRKRVSRIKEQLKAQYQESKNGTR